MPVANDNVVLRPAAYGPAEVVVVEAPNHECRPYWRMIRLPGATIQYGYRTVREAVAGEPVRTLPLSGAAAL